MKNLYETMIGDVGSIVSAKVFRRNTLVELENCGKYLEIKVFQKGKVTATLNVPLKEGYENSNSRPDGDLQGSC